MSASKGYRKQSFGFVLALVLTSFFTAPSIHATSLQWTTAQIESLLLDGNDSDKRRIAEALQLTIPKEARRGARNDAPCDDFDSVSVNDVPLSTGGTQVELQISSLSCEYTYLAVLDQEKPGIWEHIGTIRIFSKYQEPEIAFRSLISKAEKEIIVTGDQTDAGTGMELTNLSIWKLFPSGLQLVLHQPYKAVFAIPATIEGKKENTDEEENDEFLLVDTALIDSDPDNSSQVIVEKQNIRQRKIEITRWWRFHWDADRRIFEKASWWPTRAFSDAKATLLAQARPDNK